MNSYPKLTIAEKLEPGLNRLLICAYGFEERSLGWTNLQVGQGKIVSNALVVRYKNPKGKNKIAELKHGLKKIGVSQPTEVTYDVNSFEDIESKISSSFENIQSYDEVVLDITALTKFLILIFLFEIRKFQCVLRLVYTEARSYAPSFEEFKKSKDKIIKSINYPTKGFGKILRARALSSIRMQGQPVTLVAFTSFNEQLVRHMLGTISPHNLLFINGCPPREDNKWREAATMLIHEKLISEYQDNNKFKNGLLERCVSTLTFEETIKAIDEIYIEFALYERIIVAVTGSKMQTVGIFFSKVKYPDLHIEYPSPDSYYIKGFSVGTREVYQAVFPSFKDFTIDLAGSK